MADNKKFDTIGLSRRKMLAGLGAVGIASAGAGLGTTAYFNDTESFEGNQLTAGQLDLLVDWQQTYDFGEGDTFVSAHPDHDGDGEQSVDIDGEVFTYSDFPDESDEDSNGANLPVLDCDNIPPLSEAYFNVDPVTGEEMETLVQFSDVKPGDSGEITFSLHLCDNPGYIWMQAGNVSESGGAFTEPESLVDPENLGDLGDAIEARLWYDEDCDNVYDGAEPVDIMLTLDFSGSMLYDQYGGVVNTDEIAINGGTYPETTKIDLVELGTRQFIDFLQNANADVQVGVAYFDGDSDGTPRIGLLQGLTTDLNTVDSALSGLRQKLANVVSGSTNDPNPTGSPAVNEGDPDPYSNADDIATGTYIGEGVDVAQEELTDNGRSGAAKRNIVLSDGESFNGSGGSSFASPVDAADSARAPPSGAIAPSPGSVETDVYTINVNGSASTLLAMAGPAGGAGGDLLFFNDLDDPLNIPTVFGNLAAQATQEKVIMEDTLANVLAELADGNGIPLDGNRATLYDELNDPADDPDRDAFRGDGVMHCIALSWELPSEVGNEVQGDTLGFDLGFYTEQERHNDGAGPGQAPA
ncbi:SipW-cognate class signal peptide [Halorubrum xinjiangense]|uniref:SipW-cognate class signal peptide n=1 Tax=Halorubrum xinjiangense TaxID=261291 RepID=A0A1G7QW59_9EURY|nr:SipW-dependent-type signal peptide and vWA domain-containing protein [Halorubrum xinjiangense]SDG02745.1 SipW-cognate class signal peptide [Halorubrum xinjiangense]